MLGGPLAGVAVNEISKKLLGKENGSEEEVATAIAAGDPSTLIKLKEIEADLRKTLAEAGIKLEELEVKDRDSARARQVAMKDWTPNVLGAIVVLGFFAVQWYLLDHVIDGEQKDYILRTLGTLDALLVMVFQYFFGSSRGSKEKDAILGRVATED